MASTNVYFAAELSMAAYGGLTTGSTSDQINELTSDRVGVSQRQAQGFAARCDIWLRGAGYDQIVDLYNWWMRASSPEGTTVQQYVLDDYLPGTAPQGAIPLYSVSIGGRISSFLHRICGTNFLASFA